jgi:hypothetical protein
MPSLTTGQWQTILVVAAVVVNFLLVQTDVPLDPVVKLVLGALNVAFAALSPAALSARGVKSAD